MRASTPIAVASRSFSRHPVLRSELLVEYPWGEIAKMLFAASVAAFVARLSLHNLALPAAKLLAGLVLYGIVYAVLAMKLQLVSKTEIVGLLHELRDRFGPAPLIRPNANLVSRPFPSSSVLSGVRPDEQK